MSVTEQTVCLFLRQHHNASPTESAACVDLKEFNILADLPSVITPIIIVPDKETRTQSAAKRVYSLTENQYSKYDEAK